MNRSDTTLLSIFGDALACESPEERAAQLDRACGDDVALRAEIDALLEAHEVAGDFLKGRETPFDVAAEPANDEAIGTVVGPYKLLEQIGEGGMGVVYMAEQQSPVRRQVALKIIKPGMDSRKVIARFEAERQALALMEHPHIARVLDAGTIERRPYFVMELVKGIPITQYCDNRQLDLRARLELFIPVCEAVQHAHQKGVIHRDLKPSNVLVADYDEQPVAKIIDFGVAKAVGQQLTETTMFTGFGQVVGTIEYMSPEQAKLNQLDIDTRTDVYSLGVLLYELITGSTPFGQQRTENAAFDEMLRIVREDPPPKPSTRLSTSATLPAIAANRGMEPARLGKTVRGELDWIAMKCLEKDRNRRYETASALAHDLRRYLRHEAVAAGPPSAAYRLRKFARRQRGLLVWAGLVAATLFVGIVASISQAVRATKAESLAQSRLETERIAHQQTDEARAQADAHARQARQAVDEMYTQVAEQWLAQQPQLEPLQREFLEKALQFYTGFAAENDTRPDERLETARAYRRVAEIRHKLGQTSESENAYQQAVERGQALAHEFPSDPQYRSELAATLHKLGVLLGDTGRYQDEEKLHRRALSLEEQLAADFPSVSSYQRDLGRGHWFVAQVLVSQQRRREAIPALQSALTIQNALAERFPSVPEYRENVAECYVGLGQALHHIDQHLESTQAFGAATTVLERLVNEFPSNPSYRNQLGNACYWRMWHSRLSSESEQYLLRALEVQEQLASDFPTVADYRYDLFRSQGAHGWLLGRTNRPEKAERAFQKAMTIGQQLVADSPTVHYYQGGLALAYYQLGEIEVKVGRLLQAEGAYRHAIALFEKLVAEFPNVPTYGPDLRQSYCHLGSVLNAVGRSDEAADAFRRARNVDLSDSADTNHLAWMLATFPDPDFRDPVRAVELAKKACELMPKKAKYWITLGTAHYRAGNWSDALKALKKGRNLKEDVDGRACCFLAMAHWQLGNKQDAGTWYERAVECKKTSHHDDHLVSFIEEAAALMGIDQPDLPGANDH